MPTSDDPHGARRASAQPETVNAQQAASQRVAALRQEIAEHNQRYYQDAAPTISDQEYDALYRELIDLETAYPDLLTR